MAARTLIRRAVPMLLGATLGPGACARHTPAREVPDCRPAQGVLPVGTDPGGLVGSYHLVLIAIRGPAAGASVSGTLELAERQGSISGSAAIALDSVGAQRYGDLGSSDPMAPGVLALPQRDVILLRFGSEANRKDVQPFEGPYTVLHVRQLTASGFAGTWASGAMRTEAEGHFCAVRRR